MKKDRNKVAFLGNPLTLLGDVPQIGEKAPDFQVLDAALNEVSLSDSAGKVRVLLAVPSLDTPVCDTETRTFNMRAADLSDTVRVIVISMDLPFAQQRWCGAAGIDRVVALSDHRDASFGQAYGVLIKELRLLCRAVFVIDSADCLRYVELVPEITDEPNYDKVLAVVKGLAS